MKWNVRLLPHRYWLFNLFWLWEDSTRVTRYASDGRVYHSLTGTQLSHYEMEFLLHSVAVMISWFDPRWSLPTFDFIGPRSIEVPRVTSINLLYPPAFPPFRKVSGIRSISFPFTIHSTYLLINRG